MAWVSGGGGGWGELGNLQAAKIIIQMVIGRCKVCSSTGFFLA